MLKDLISSAPPEELSASQEASFSVSTTVKRLLISVSLRSVLSVIARIPLFRKERERVLSYGKPAVIDEYELVGRVLRRRAIKRPFILPFTRWLTKATLSAMILSLSILVR